MSFFKAAVKFKVDSFNDTDKSSQDRETRNSEKESEISSNLSEEIASIINQSFNFPSDDEIVIYHCHKKGCVTYGSIGWVRYIGSVVTYH